MIDPLSLTALIKMGEGAINRIWPDKTKRAEEMRKLEELAQTGDLAKLNAHVQLMLAQIDLNKTEAQSKRLFIAGWRPAVGWVGVVALALTFIPKALVLTYVWWKQCAIILAAGIPESGLLVIPAFPELGMMDVIGLLGSMLGFGAMRTIDKRGKVQTDSLE